ncbi:hypothetical protein GGTG_04949 [Gaeumannomyces tritici R3-111a-1]|uniref:Uncharacterized protein n=1 Tax=Gaeumannomyces tritici (strain R3-111a-1) TaxID=644352 RepID=J3NUJ3_GAET3|nr:hypothetical protein GGTG_04949 [Gaeumannomyces tritici R3-111a-1]EJT79866.1 hypothetical protein GGTG_04949 [Gaeumannomyces tritici R3-111a-1]
MNPPSTQAPGETPLACLPQARRVQGRPQQRHQYHPLSPATPLNRPRALSHVKPETEDREVHDNHDTVRTVGMTYTVTYDPRAGIDVAKLVTAEHNQSPHSATP